MTQPPVKKIVLYCPHGYQAKLDSLVIAWVADGVKYVGVVGLDASKVEDVIDELCVGDGSKSYPMLTASHGADETIDDATLLAEQFAGDFGDHVRVVIL